MQSEQYSRPTIDNITVHTVEDAVHTVEDAVHTVEDAVHTVENTVHTVSNTVHTVNNTMNTIKEIPTMGRLHLIIGPMYSGKTTSLAIRYRRYNVAGKKCLLIKHKHDTRYDDSMLCTHDAYKLDAVSCLNLFDLDIHPTYEVICIDEIQFYPDSIEFCEKMALAGKIIEASGLNCNYLREPFPNMSSLIAKADKIDFLTAVCMICMNEGAYTKRLSKETTEVLIGGKDKYAAVCRSCYFK